MSYVIWPHEVTSANQLGGKGGALYALRQADLAIPAWFALSPQAFEISLGDLRQEVWSTAPDTATITSALNELELSSMVRSELARALVRLCPPNELVAVRSSARDEDGTRYSFAGQLDSFLGVSPEAVPEAVVAVWRSAFNERLLTYRREHNLSLISQAPAVLIQRMVNADVSGVAFSADPVSGRRGVAVVSALRGFGTALVSGEADADTYHIDRTGRIISREIVSKTIAHRYAKGHPKSKDPTPVQPHALIETVQSFSVEQQQAGQPALTDKQAKSAAALARRAEKFFGRPQDIEWAMADEQLYLLQSRPITTLINTPDPDAVLNLWDNSNIAESYPGITTPLTFSFARRAYEEVYRQFCRMMAVPEPVIADHTTTFQRMLGLVQGRIYYNLLSWYRVLALLPGYKINRRFMEQMMGVDEGVPDELLDEQSPPSRAARVRDGLHLGRTLIGFLANYLLLPRRIDAFYHRLNQALDSDSNPNQKTSRPDLSQHRPDELVAYYRDLERQLLTRWDAPLVNDFFAMIFFGLLRKLCQKWCDDPNGTLQNELLSQSGGIISAEPAALMRQMAQLAVNHPSLISSLCQDELPEMLAGLAHYPEFETLYQAYLDKFGDRCLEELKLESPTLYDDPSILLRSMGYLAQHLSENAETPPPESTSQSDTLVQEAEARVRGALAHHPGRRIVFNWVLKNGRRLIRNRENLRFERTRLFGRARQIFVELGRRFYALELLAEPRDIFFLEVEEALGFVDGTASSGDLKGLVAVRQCEFERYQIISDLPNRFETRGIVAHAVTSVDELRQPATVSNEAATSAEMLQGLGCSPGLVQGPVRIVDNPKIATLKPGEILVARRTDPGWIMLFPVAAGLLVEHGSLLSHSAIVSREMGLPAIVSLKGVTSWLQNGDWIELDGGTGQVRKIAQPEEA